MTRAMLYERQFSGRALNQPNAVQKVERYSHSVFGGPKAARINYTGGELDLWELIERLRCPVEIYSDFGDRTWWGFVAGVELKIGHIAISVSIDSMYNRVAVAYNLVDADLVGERQTTEWMEDADSVASYGDRELLQTASESTAEWAAAIQEMLLNQKRYPIPALTMSGQTAQTPTASLLCRGWFSAFDWVYYSKTIAPVACTTSGTGTQVLGNIDNNAIIAQSFQLPRQGTVRGIYLLLKKIGSPTDDFIYEIRSDNSGVPSSTPGSRGTISGSSISTEFAWKYIELEAGADVVLAGIQPYWIYITRVKQVEVDDEPVEMYVSDADNYYELDVTEGLEYTGGVMKLGNISATWRDRSPDADLNFMVPYSITEDTGIQAADIVTASGQFINSLAYINSGILSNPVRDGDGKAGFELMEILKMGTSNKRRILATIDAERNLMIYEEPQLTATNWLIDRNGDLKDRFDNPIRRETCPVGMWVRLKDVIPSSADISRLADPTLIFVDEAEYEVASDTLKFIPRDVQNPWEIGVVKDG